MATVDRSAPRRFLETLFEPGDWVAVFLKSYDTGEVQQRVVSVAEACSGAFQAWLRSQNAARWNVYVSVNAMTPGIQSRRREQVAAVRHVFLEADHDGDVVLARIAARPELPAPSCVTHSSPGRVHVLWRAERFTAATVEALQRCLARELGTDVAATAASQTTRVPGFFNHKRARAYMVWTEFADAARRFGPESFGVPNMEGAVSGPDDDDSANQTPRTARERHANRVPRAARVSHSEGAPRARGASVRRLRSVATSVPRAAPSHTDVLTRARGYLAKVPPAVAGRHGDVHTFRVCCRLVRGFGLTDAEALQLLAEWNRGCAPPWSERELVAKLARAHRYGREPYAALIGPVVRARLLNVRWGIP